MWLYASGLTPSSLEARWLASQELSLKSKVAGLSDNTIVRMIRSRCYGTCPAYEVTIAGSGKVEFRGIDYVCNIAPAPVQIDTYLVSGVIDGMRQIGFMSLPNFTSRDITDRATVAVSVVNGGREHTVVHYLGDTRAPVSSPGSRTASMR
jgi:hypothetical protein